MSDSDNDNAAAIDKVVGAFRAQREQGKSAADEASTGDAAAEETTAPDSADVEPEQKPTTVEKLEDDPKPAGGGNSEAETKAFKIPTEIIAAAAAASAGTDEASTAGVVEESVVGDPIKGESLTGEPGAEADDTDKALLVEQSIALAEEQQAEQAPEPATVELSKPDLAKAPEAANTANAEAPTTQMKVPAAAAAAAAAGAAAATAAAAPKPAPQVVVPAQPAPAEPKKGRGKLIAIALAAVVLIAVIAIGLWYFLAGSSPESKVANAAEDYQSAMNDGNLGDLRDITCGEKHAYYANVSEEAFNKAYQAQKATNQMMTFDEVKAVQIDGDTARVGVDMYPVNDPSKKVSAQITLQNVGGDWKVCMKP